MDEMQRAEARAAQELSMTSTVTIRTKAPDTRDTVTGAYIPGAVSSVVTKGNLIPFSAAEMLQAGIQRGRTLYHLYLPWNAAVTLSSTLDVDGSGLEVDQVLLPSSPDVIAVHAVVSKG